MKQLKKEHVQKLWEFVWTQYNWISLGNQTSVSYSGWLASCWQWVGKIHILQSKIIQKNWWTLLRMIPNFKIVSCLWHVLRNLYVSAMGTRQEGLKFSSNVHILPEASLWLEDNASAVAKVSERALIKTKICTCTWWSGKLRSIFFMHYCVEFPVLKNQKKYGCSYTCHECI